MDELTSRPMTSWSDPELEASERARKYRPVWMHGLRVLAWLVIAAGCTILVLDLLGRFPETTRHMIPPTQTVLIFVAVALNWTSMWLDNRWKRLHPEAR